MKVQVIDITTGRPKEVGRIKFRVLPRQGDLVMFRIGAVKGVFAVDAVIHKIDLGDQEITLRIRQQGSGSGSGSAPPRPQQRQPLPQQAQALPPRRGQEPSPQFPESDGGLYYSG